MMKYICALNKVSNNSLDESILGGKGFNLYKLERYGFKIPQTIILTTNAYVDFLTANDLTELVEDLSERLTSDELGIENFKEDLLKLRNLIMDGSIPQEMEEQIREALYEQKMDKKPLAVRSSGSLEDSQKASFAGIHNSFLNVLDTEQMLKAIKACYASLWTERAITYRIKMNLVDQKIEQAVVIMEMVSAQSSGIAFSCDPLTGRPDTIVINANFGLGEAIVSGNMDPDEYKITTKALIPEILEKRIGKKEGKTITLEGGGVKQITSMDQSQVLGNDDIIRLSLLIQRVHDALGKGENHQDVEWVFDGREFSLVQARPVTHVPKYTYPALKSQPEIWSNANVKDAMPMVQTIFGWRFMKLFSEAILSAATKLTGYQVREGLEYSKLFQGRAYFNLSLIQWEFYDAFGVPPKGTNETMGGHQPEIEVPSPTIKERINKLRRLLKLVNVMMKAGADADKAFEKVTSFCQNYLTKDLMLLDDKQLIMNWKDILKEVITYSSTMALGANSAAISFANLTKKLDKYFPGRGVHIANSLMMGQGKITSAEHGYRLMTLVDIAKADEEALNFLKSESYRFKDWKNELSNQSVFKQAFKEYLSEFGHRAIYECDISNPRWREDPSYLFDYIHSCLDQSQLKKWKTIQTETSKQAWNDFIPKIPFYSRSFIKSQIKKTIVNAEKREMAKSQLVRFAEPLRLLALEMGRRFVQKGLLSNSNDIFHFSWAEAVSILRGDWDGSGLEILIQERKDRLEELQKLTPSDIILNGVPQIVDEKQRVTSSAFLTGLGVASGRVEGKVRIITHPSEGGRLQYGEILAAPSTDPAWTPLFLKASGIIMETGGFLSHGAIVSREYGIPAVVNIPGLISMLKDGDKVIVDGNEGKVYISS
jgi:rifampicin phosphotransferase